MKSPSVSGALSYKELCMAAKHEEKQLVKVKKCQDNEKGLLNINNRTDRQISGSSVSRAGNGNNSQTVSKDNRRCYICNKVGHVCQVL